MTAVTVANPSNSIAFFIHIAISDMNEREIWPIFYDDNYFTLMPKESRSISAKYQSPDKVQVNVDLWNNISR